MKCPTITVYRSRSGRKRWRYRVRAANADIATLGTALLAAQDGDDEPLKQWWARRPDTGQRNTRNEAEPPCGRQPESDHVHVNR